MDKYLFAEKEYEAALLSDLFEQLDDIKDSVLEAYETEYQKSKISAIRKIQDYLLHYYD